jgi:hypothetical protein
MHLLFLKNMEYLTCLEGAILADILSYSFFDISGLELSDCGSNKTLTTPAIARSPAKIRKQAKYPIRVLRN